MTAFNLSSFYNTNTPFVIESMEYFKLSEDQIILNHICWKLKILLSFTQKKPVLLFQNEK